MATELIAGPDPLDRIVFDALLSLTPNDSVDVTDHPVEEGANISDHARPTPSTVDLVAMVTDTPILIGRSLREPPQRPEAAQELLLAARGDGRLVDLITTTRSWFGMAITGLGTQRSGSAITFTLALKEMRIVASETVEAPEPRDTRGEGTKDLGRQPATGSAVGTAGAAAGAAGSGPSSSLLFSIVGL